MPVTESLLRKTAMLMRLPPGDVPLGAGDAIHTVTALETGDTEIWTNDHHLLAAVAHFGLAGAQCLNGSLQFRWSPRRPTHPPYVYRSTA